MNTFIEPIQSWDISIINWIQENCRCAFLDGFMSAITYIGGMKGLVCIMLAVVLLFWKKTRKTGIMIGAALLLGVIIGNGILKNVFARTRPYELEGALVTVKDLLTGPESDKSFPSGHSLAVFETATVLMYYKRSWGIPALVIAILVAISRLYLYVHFPTDVIAGAVCGIIFAILGIIIVNMVYKYLLPKFKKNKLQ